MHCSTSNSIRRHEISPVCELVAGVPCQSHLEILSRHGDWCIPYTHIVHICDRVSARVTSLRWFVTIWVTRNFSSAYATRNRNWYSFRTAQSSRKTTPFFWCIKFFDATETTYVSLKRQFCGSLVHLFCAERDDWKAIQCCRAVLSSDTLRLNEGAPPVDCLNIQKISCINGHRRVLH